MIQDEKVNAVKALDKYSGPVDSSKYLLDNQGLIILTNLHSFRAHSTPTIIVKLGVSGIYTISVFYAFLVLMS